MTWEYLDKAAKLKYCCFQRTSTRSKTASPWHQSMSPYNLTHTTHDLYWHESYTQKYVAHLVKNCEKEKDLFSESLYYGWDFFEKMSPVLNNSQSKIVRNGLHSRWLYFLNLKTRLWALMLTTHNHGLPAFRPLVPHSNGGTKKRTVVAQDQTQVARRKMLYPYIIYLVLTNAIQIYTMFLR
jgi:hypothetical protein